MFPYLECARIEGIYALRTDKDRDSKSGFPSEKV